MLEWCDDMRNTVSVRYGEPRLKGAGANTTYLEEEANPSRWLSPQPEQEATIASPSERSLVFKVIGLGQSCLERGGAKSIH